MVRFFVGAGWGGMLLALTATAGETLPLSRLRLRAMSTGWGSVQADRSCAGHPLRIGEKTYAAGVGTHAASDMMIHRNGATRFLAEVGVDAEVGARGSVVFNVYGDDTLLWSSGVMRGGEPAKPVDVALAPHARIRLQVADGGDDINHDHANWADARFIYEGAPPVAIIAPRPGGLPELAARAPQEPVELFNGRNLENWIADLPQGGSKGEVWRIEEGILYCAGKPAGHLITDSAWKDYRLIVEWRWPPGSEGGNNGVLVHSSDLHALYKMFPRSIEVQLASGNAGDFWVIGEDIEVPDMASRRQGRRIRKLEEGAERPIGEWNQMIIDARGDTLTVWVNGRLVNKGHACTVREGRISLQSEGAPCQFRRVTILPLPAE